MPPSRPALLALLCLAALLGACSLAPFGGGEEVEAYYVDAGRGFAVAHPATWARQREEEGASVRWLPGAAEGIVAVTSLPPAAGVGGYERMLADFAAARAGFVPAGREEIVLGDGTPALQVRGRTPASSHLAVFVTTRRRVLVLEYAAPPGRFDRNLPLVRAMAASLTVLD